METLSALQRAWTCAAVVALCAFGAAGCASVRRPEVPVATEKNLGQLTPIELEVLQRQLRRIYPEVGPRIVALTRKCLDASAHSERFPRSEPASPGAMVLDEFTPLSFVEQTLALALTDTPADASRLVAEFRYAPPQIGESTFCREIIPDWTHNISRYLQDRTVALAPSDQRARLNRTIKRSRGSGFWKFFGWAPSKDLSVEAEYIPSAKVEAVRAQLRSGDLILILDGKGSEAVAALGFCSVSEQETTLIRAEAHVGRVVEGCITRIRETVWVKRLPFGDGSGVERFCSCWFFHSCRGGIPDEAANEEDTGGGAVGSDSCEGACDEAWGGFGGVDS